MAIKKTEAFLLKAFNWSESSRTISFFTRDHGKLPLIDRGGRSMSAKRGRALPFARLALTYYSSERSSNGYLSEISIEEAWSFESEGSLGRLAFGSAACELLWLVLPDEEPHADMYHYTLKLFALLSSANRQALPAIFVAYFLRLLSMLGYQPVLSGCVGCGKALEDFKAPRLSFSPDRGGLLCPACQVSGESYISLQLEDLLESLKLQAVSLEQAAAKRVASAERVAPTEWVDFARASRIIDALMRFLRTQTGISKLNSLDFLDKLKQTPL